MTFLHRQTVSKAFTIVEIVIVIAVIGILASISIVSYNGYQERARAAAAIAGVNQATDLLEAYQLKNGGLYPSTLAAAGVSNNNSVEYQYTQISGGTNYCVTATSKNVSYKMSQDTKPTAGGCAGHGANGVAAVTNLSTNPRATAAGAGWLSNNGAIYPVTKGVAITGHPTGIPTSSRSQLNAGQVSGCALSEYSVDTLGNSATQRTVGAWVMVNTSGYQARIVGTGLPTVWTSLTANTWTYINSPGPLTGYASIYICKISGNSLESDIGYATGAMVVAGTTNYNYADGYSSGWVWSGTANNSTSTGAPL